MAANSHKHTRLVNYGRSRPSRGFRFRLWFIIPIAACLAFAVALILGNTLGEMVAPADSETVTEEKNITTTPENIGGKSIIAPFVSLRGITYDTANQVAYQIPDGATAVSFELFSPTGYPYYHSDVASSFNKPSGELTLKNAFKTISEHSIYASVLFPSSLFSVTDQNKTAVTAAYEATLAKELFLAGADEIVVFFSPLGSGETVIREGFFELMNEYVAALRIHSDDARIGITITAQDLQSLSDPTAIDGLCRTADFCAVDLTSFSDIDKLTSTLVSISPTALRLDMRFIISESGKSEEFILAQSELLEKLGADNIQYAETVQ